MKDYSWLNADSKKFLKRGYLEEGETPEERIEIIAKTAEAYLKIKGFADKFTGYILYRLQYGQILVKRGDCLFLALVALFLMTWKKFLLKYLKWVQCQR